MFSTAIIAGGVNDLHDVSRPVRARRARGSSMSSLLGVELPTPVNFIIAFVDAKTGQVKSTVAGMSHLLPPLPVIRG